VGTLMQEGRYCGYSNAGAAVLWVSLMQEGQAVEFEVITDETGRKKANDVSGVCARVGVCARLFVCWVCWVCALCVVWACVCLCAVCVHACAVRAQCVCCACACACAVLCVCRVLCAVCMCAPCSAICASVRTCALFTSERFGVDIRSHVCFHAFVCVHA
jgi:hypothetical protein